MDKTRLTEIKNRFKPNPKSHDNPAGIAHSLAKHLVPSRFIQLMADQLIELARLEDDIRYLLTYITELEAHSPKEFYLDMAPAEYQKFPQITRPITALIDHTANPKDAHEELLKRWGILHDLVDLNKATTSEIEEYEILNRVLRAIEIFVIEAFDEANQRQPFYRN